jgi:hypothetical protein
MFFIKQKRSLLLLTCLFLIVAASCAPRINRPVNQGSSTDGDVPTLSPIFSLPTKISAPTNLPADTPSDQPASTVSAAPTATSRPLIKDEGPFSVQVDISQDVHLISDMIYGVSGAPIDVLEDLNVGLTSWGGNPSTRYNWKLGNAWNAGSDWFYRNGNYDFLTGSASDQFAREVTELGIAGRLSVPTLGWVAKDSNNDTCSFPEPDGTCGNAGGANCQNPWPIANPETANVPSTAASIAEWMTHLFTEQQFDIRFIALDNEPELWGFTHYDVHPTCTPYGEILRKHLEYTAAIHEVVPDVELAGPTTCCWFYYWDSAAGIADKLLNGNQDFLPWFLDNVHKNDQKNGWRSLHVLDIHYYPEGLYNDLVNEEIAALRLRSTKSLWDKTYVDESWIAEAVHLIPRMKGLIDKHYPGTKLGISEWNWGADETMNGALAIADVLGIFGREDLYYAAYWRYPPVDSPGYWAFKMFRNYDGEGGSFGDTSVQAQASHFDTVSSYASLDSKTGKLHLILINKVPQENISLNVDLGQYRAKRFAEQYQYSSANLMAIQKETLDIGSNNFDIELPPYSITHLVFYSQ